LSAPLVSIVLPVYNQANHLEQVVDEYESALARVQAPHELILVTNDCHDNSHERALGLVSRHRTVLATNSVRGGWGLAVKLGLSEAKGDLLCYTNLARTSAQDLALLLIYAIAYPEVVVKANRKIREGWGRRFGSLLYNLECRALFDLPNWDVNGTPKVFPRRFDKLLALRRDDDLIDIEFNIICRDEGYPIVEVPIFSSRRHGGRSTTNLRSAVRLYWGAYQLWRARRTRKRPTTSRIES
jgi:glycosyltransferase involved in cell wall biosynthesis